MKRKRDFQVEIANKKLRGSESVDPLFRSLPLEAQSQPFSRFLLRSSTLIAAEHCLDLEKVKKKTVAQAKSWFRGIVGKLPFDCPVYDPRVNAVMLCNPKFRAEILKCKSQSICIKKIESRMKKSEWDLVISGDNIKPISVSWVSSLKALKGLKVRETHRHKVASACRTAVYYSQILPVRLLTNCDDHDEVDHVLPFKDILEDWLKSESKSVKDIKVSKDRRHFRGKFYKFDDPQLLESWCSFHNRHAIVRVLPKKIHKLVTRGKCPKEVTDRYPVFKV